MAVAFRSAAEAGTGTDATSLTVAVPAGVVAGDVMLLFGVTSDGGGFDALTGWAEFIDDQATGGAPPSVPGLSVWRRVASSEPSDYTITPTGGSQGICAQMLAFSGVDNTTPLDATTTVATGDSTNANPAAITTQTDNALIVVACWHDSETITTHTVPSGYTDPDSIGRIVGVGGGNGCTMGAAYANAPTSPAGSTNPGAFTTATEQWGAVTIALRAATGYPNDIIGVSAPAKINGVSRSAVTAVNGV